MKDQIFLSTPDLTAEFNRQKESVWRDVPHVPILLKALSRALEGLRDAGIDAQLTLEAGNAGEAFAMVSKAKTGNVSTYWLVLTGVLKVGQGEYLLAVCNAEQYSSPENPPPPPVKTSVSKIYLSDMKMYGGSLGGDFRSTCYDLDNDSEAIAKLQKRIIEIAAGDAIIEDNDPGEAFNRILPAHIRKPNLGL